MFDFEEEFLQRLLQQDETAFARFYAETVDDFSRYIQFRYSLPRAELLDIVSQLYLKIWTNLSRCTATTKAGYYGYVWTICRNLLTDTFKKKRESSFADYRDETQGLEDDLLSDETSPLDFVDGQYDYDRIVDAMQSLDELSKQIVFFKYVDDYSYEEIAIMLGENIPKIRQKSSRAMRFLKDLLG